MHLFKQREIRRINHNLCDNMRDYIYHLKGRVCEECGETNNLEIHHKRYGLDVSINDLSILCHDCHVGANNYTRLDYR